ncbi:hypothetical protein [Mucilaginibacter sp.]
MKHLFLLLLTACLSFSASAQWSIFGKRQRMPDLIPAKCIAFKMPKSKIIRPKLYITSVGRSDYNLELLQAQVTKVAQHHMRFRMYDIASYDFNDLAQLYIQQNRLSEAKWFFLQSNNISRTQNNNKLTIANLIQLAYIKSAIGDFVLAQQDLLEARDIASNKGYLNDLLEVEKSLNAIQHNRFVSVRTDLRYDDALQTTAMVN